MYCLMIKVSEKGLRRPSAVQHGVHEILRMAESILWLSRPPGEKKKSVHHRRRRHCEKICCYRRRCCLNCVSRCHKIWMVDFHCWKTGYCCCCHKSEVFHKSAALCCCYFWMVDPAPCFIHLRSSIVFSSRFAIPRAVVVATVRPVTSVRLRV